DIPELITKGFLHDLRRQPQEGLERVMSIDVHPAAVAELQMRSWRPGNVRWLFAKLGTAAHRPPLSDPETLPIRPEHLPENDFAVPFPRMRTIVPPTNPRGIPGHPFEPVVYMWPEWDHWRWRVGDTGKYSIWGASSDD